MPRRKTDYRKLARDYLKSYLRCWVSGCEERVVIRVLRARMTSPEDVPAWACEKHSRSHYRSSP